MITDKQLESVEREAHLCACVGATAALLLVAEVRALRKIEKAAGKVVHHIDKDWIIEQRALQSLLDEAADR